MMITNDKIIDVNNVSMEFVSNVDARNSLKEFIFHLLQGKIKYKKFEALKDVSFTVNRGEVLGIIGHNGAGKSTTLKLISHLFEPTKGSVTTKGIIVPMLELGAGFDPDLTGNENIYLNGALLGYSEKYIKDHYDEIVEFSGIKEFLNSPLRGYSSGMTMRLAFSIASIVKPDILIVDEILSVGDAEFQEKSRNRMMELMHSGTAVVFTSHNMKEIRELCNKVLWLDHGKMVEYGDTNKVCDDYIEHLNRKDKK